MAEEDSNTLISSEKQIRALGLPIPKPFAGAANALMWPSNVADLTTVELAQHMTWWTAWSAYARYNLARAETNHEAFSTENRIAREVAIAKSKGDFKSVTELKASISQFPEMQRLEAKMLKAEAEKKLLKALLEGFEAKGKTISREVSRRSAEWEEGRSKYTT